MQARRGQGQRWRRQACGRASCHATIRHQHWSQGARNTRFKHCALAAPHSALAILLASRVMLREREGQGDCTGELVLLTVRMCYDCTLMQCCKGLRMLGHIRAELHFKRVSQQPLRRAVLPDADRARLTADEVRWRQVQHVLTSCTDRCDGRATRPVLSELTKDLLMWRKGFLTLWMRCVRHLTLTLRTSRRPRHDCAMHA